MRKTYTKLEAPFTSKLKKWMKYSMKFTYGWEVKYPKKEKYYFTQDKSFSKEVDIMLSYGSCFIYKHPDVSRLGTPGDGYTMWHEPGYFFFTWNGKDFYVIEVSRLKWFAEYNKFLTEEDAEKICEYKSKLGEVLNI